MVLTMGCPFVLTAAFLHGLATETCAAYAGSLLASKSSKDGTNIKHLTFNVWRESFYNAFLFHMEIIAF